MSQDPRLIAEARALLACIQVTRDPVEQNRLWNRYYRLSDSVFPEAAALRKRYCSLEGDARQRFKTEYMELVRRLWRAMDPAAAYEGPLSEEEVAASVQNPRAKRPPDYTPRPARRGAVPALRWAALLMLLSALAGGGIWAWQQALDRAAQPAPPVTAQIRLPATLLEIPEGPPATSIAPPEASPPAPDEIPDPLDEIPEARIEAEVNAAIQPVFTPMPDALRGRGDQVSGPDGEFEDVYIIEGASQYYVRLPETGGVATVRREGASLQLSDDAAAREELLALWKENREAIDRADVLREEEKLARMAAAHKALERQRAARKRDQEAAAWRARAADWAALAPGQRHTARVRAHSDWRAIQGDAERLRDLYTNIARTYEYIGVADARMAELNQAYRRLARDFGPNMDVEGALLVYGWDREDILKQLAEWEREYYRLEALVNEKYPEYEARVNEIARLDEALPEDIRAAEEAGSWDAGPAGPGTSVGTGFIVAKGHILTCAHVVRGGGAIRVTDTDGNVHEARIVATDAANDWCLLEVSSIQGEPIPMAPGTPNVGATIYCLGYPLGGIRDNNDPIVGSGNIAATSRIDGDQRFLQITAPINPGNSGGPVLDQQGRWVGVVSQKLNDLHSLQTSQSVAQGLNYALKSSHIDPLIRSLSPVNLARGGGGHGTVSLEQITKTASPSIVKIEVQ